VLRDGVLIEIRLVLCILLLLLVLEVRSEESVR
jgi:hypothetical protein